MSDVIHEAVRSKYGATALSGLSSDHDGVRAVAEAFGYTAEELAAIPAEANMGLSCGNPTATASLKPGEVVVDLGSGGGLDVFLAARKVGPTGQAIGIDMTPEMVELARRNAEKAVGDDGRPLGNVAFHLARIDAMPLEDASVDCVISNCVLNLVPDKPAAFREIVRVLKPGGRLAASDIALKKPLPPEIAGDLMAYVGCIGGAILIDDYRAALHEAGFAHVEILDSGADLNAYAKIESQAGCCSPAPSPATAPQSVLVSIGEGACCSPEPAAATSTTGQGGCCGTVEAPASTTTTPELLERLADLLRTYDVNEYAASVKVFAVKPSN